METDVIFRYSFKEFESNYDTDLSQWLEDYPDATERDFLIELKGIYDEFVRWSGRNYFRGYKVEHFESRMSPYDDVYLSGESTTNWSGIEKYHEVLSDKIKRHIMTVVNADPHDVDFMEYYFDCNYAELELPYEFDPYIHSVLKNFFDYDNDLDMLVINKKLAKNFEFSVIKIADYIDERLKNVHIKKEPVKKITIPATAIVSPPVTEENEPKPKINTSCSVQVALLKELGFFDLPSIKEMSSAQKEYIISRLLNKSERDVRGNINALNPDSGEDLSKYTSPTDTTIQKAIRIIKEKQ
jgi:hypothetical protein